MKAQTRELIMADAAQAAAQATPAPTHEQWLELLKQLATEAMTNGELAQASKLMAQASKLQAGAKAAELEAKASMVAEAKLKLEPAIHKLIADTLGELWELVDGYWVSMDKASGLSSFSLFKPAKATRASSSNGASKRYSTTQTLLTVYGDVKAQHLMDKHGLDITWDEAYASRVELAATYRHGDTKNFLHTDIHKAMLKLAGEIS